MVYEMRTYTVKVGKQHAYMKHFEEVGLPIISKYAKLVGYWYSDIGELNQVVHIWEYPDLNTREERRRALYNDKEWLENFVPLGLPMLDKQESKIMYASNFSPIQ